MEVRVVDNEYIVLKDMFDALGRLQEDGQWSNEKEKLLKFLEDIDKTSDHRILLVSSKGKKQSKETQEMDCLKLETVPIVLTQFRPTARKGSEALNTWIKFMKFVDALLTSLEVYKFIVTDKELQKDCMTRIKDAGGKPMIANQQVNIIMAKLMGLYDQGIKKVTKDELKAYQDQTTVNLLEVREFVMDKFVNAYEFMGSHSEAGKMALRLGYKKYDECKNKVSTEPIPEGVETGTMVV